MSNDIEYVINQLFKLLRRNLIEDPTDPSENQIIVDLFLVLGKCVSSSRGSYPSLLQRKRKLESERLSRRFRTRQCEAKSLIDLVLLPVDWRGDAEHRWPDERLPPL